MCTKLASTYWVLPTTRAQTYKPRRFIASQTQRVGLELNMLSNFLFAISVYGITFQVATTGLILFIMVGPGRPTHPKFTTILDGSMFHPNPFVIYNVLI